MVAQPVLSSCAVACALYQMPGSIDGLRLAHAVHKRWPPIKIILASRSKPGRDRPDAE